MESISTAKFDGRLEPNKAGDEGYKRYFIDTEWFGPQGRSVAVLLRSRLCRSCQARQVADDALMDSIKLCCSRDDGFVTPSQPLLEKAFRVLLAHGGQPLSLDDMLRELKRRGGAGPLTIPAKALDRILSRDTFYGIRPAAAEAEGQPSA